MGSPLSDSHSRAGSGRPFAGRPFRRTVLAAAGVLVVAAAGLAWAGVAAARPGVSWAVWPGSNTATIRLTSGAGPFGHWILARSHLNVTDEADGRPVGRSSSGGIARLRLPPGLRTSLLIQVTGLRPRRLTLTVTTPPPLRATGSRLDPGKVVLLLSSPLRRQRPGPLCGDHTVSFPALSEVAVARDLRACSAMLHLTAADGERAVVPVTIPAIPAIPRPGRVALYAFASPAHRAIYITVDDGWTPSPQVLSIIARTRLPVTAFLIQQAVQPDLPYWRAFVKAGGTVGDHTVSHPDLTRLSLGQATFQWRQARLALGRWLGAAPVLGRPPYGAFDSPVETAAYQAGLKALAGWSASVDSHGIHTWNRLPLEPGEIVLLHWVPGLGGQLTALLRAIHALHLNPMRLTVASFADIHPQLRSLAGD